MVLFSTCVDIIISTNGVPERGCHANMLCINKSVSPLYSVQNNSEQIYLLKLSLVVFYGLTFLFPGIFLNASEYTINPYVTI